MAVRVAYPERVKMTLKNVDQDLFARLGKLLGEGAIAADPAPFVKTALPERLRPAALRRARLTEHNPVIVFRLRRGVRFHDGHEFDSGDVRFTYEAIMKPREPLPPDGGLRARQARGDARQVHREDHLTSASTPPPSARGGWGCCPSTC